MVASQMDRERAARDEAKVEVLARLDALTHELVTLRRLTAQSWPVAGLEKQRTPARIG